MHAAGVGDATKAGEAVGDDGRARCDDALRQALHPAALEAGDAAAAGRACERLLAISPDDAEAYFVAAVCTLEGGYHPAALARCVGITVEELLR